MYTDTVTVFNKYEEQTGISWYPRVISGCDLVTDRAANVAKTGLDTADTAKLHILYRTENSEKVINNHGATFKWLPPKKWKAMEDKSEYITFQPGDLILRGEYQEEVIQDSAYTSRVSNGFYEHLNKTEDDVYLITSVGGPYTLIKHFEIGAK